MYSEERNVECRLCRKAINIGDKYILVSTVDGWRRPCCGIECAEKVKELEITKSEEMLSKVKHQKLDEIVLS
ncbi:MAG: hypothetical protein RR891_02620 [Clostridium sp.]